MECRERTVTPHVAQNTTARRSAIDRRTTRHPGYEVSQRIRKRIEEAFGWAKTVAGLRKMHHRCQSARKRDPGSAANLDPHRRLSSGRPRSPWRGPARVAICQTAAHVSYDRPQDRSALPHGQ